MKYKESCGEALHVPAEELKEQEDDKRSRSIR